MAGSKKVAPARRTVGQKSGEGRSTTGTKTARGRSAATSPVQAAQDAQEKALDPITLVTGRGGFQLISGGKDPETGKWHDDWTLEFGRKGFIEADERTVDAVQKVLAGEWEDPTSPRVSPRDFQRNGRIAQLQVVKHGLEGPPIPSWDALASDSRVETARQAGLLSTDEQIRKALRYEKQSAERTRAMPKDRQRAADPVTVQLLEGLLAATNAGIKVQGVGAAASAGVLQAGAQEL